ncbi:MAG: site-2 protease family protein [Merdibacter sp.]
MNTDDDGSQRCSWCKASGSTASATGLHLSGDRADRSAGLLPFLSLLAIFSLNIGIFNPLPIPVLDGGRIVIVVLKSCF